MQMESAETGLIHLVNLPFLEPWLLNPFNYVNKVDFGHYFYNSSMKETNPVTKEFAVYRVLLMFSS